MPNASAMATGHASGDTGIYSNTLFTNFHSVTAQGSVVQFIENDAILGELDERFNNNFINETTLLSAAHAAGYSTAAIGKLGPTLIFDHTARSGEDTIIVDDATGSAAGIALSSALMEAFTAAGLALATPSREENGKAGDAQTPGTAMANLAQQDYLSDVTTNAILPLLKARNKPFLLVFWSRDPDGTQHNQGDSLNQFNPGINGPTSLAAIRNADNDLSKIRAALTTLNLINNTDIIISSDHGFSTISKQSEKSYAAQGVYADVPEHFLPPGFVALDLAHALGLPLYDPNAARALITENHHPKAGNGLIGNNAADPDLAVAANGGSDLVYVLKADKALTKKAVEVLLAQDYVSGLFVDEALGRYPGTLTMASVNLSGAALAPKPSIVINFKSFSTGCAQPTNCAVEIADTGLQQGQGMHGSFSRADTYNFMAAIGPDFKTDFVDTAPVSNADVGRTIASILHLSIQAKGKLMGRVLVEAQPGGNPPMTSTLLLRSAPDAQNHQTMVHVQSVGDTHYFDAGGFAGLTVGVSK